MKIRQFQEEDRKHVLRLWEECNLIFPHNDPNKDINRKLKESPELFLVGVIDNEIIASAMGGYEGHRGWVYYLAVKNEYQRKGFGSQIMNELEKKLIQKGCPKLNLLVRESNIHVIEFYKSLGFLKDEVVSLGKRLIKDQSSG